MIPGPPRRELDLTPDRLPRTVWFAAGPPILAAALVWWLRAHWSELPSIYSSESGAGWHESSFRSVRSGIVTFTVFGLWMVAQGIALWYGSARTSAHKALLELSVAGAWQAVLMFSPIYLAGYLQLPWAGLLLCGLSMAAGLTLVIVFARRTRKAAGREMDSYNIGYYFDRHDPALSGPRGLNMGHPWQWALTAGSLLICAIPFFLN